MNYRYHHFSLDDCSNVPPSFNSCKLYAAHDESWCHVGIYSLDGGGLSPVFHAFMWYREILRKSTCDDFSCAKCTVPHVKIKRTFARRASPVRILKVWHTVCHNQDCFYAPLIRNTVILRKKIRAKVSKGATGAGGKRPLPERSTGGSGSKKAKRPVKTEGGDKAPDPPECHVSETELAAVEIRINRSPIMVLWATVRDRGSRLLVFP